MAYYVPTSPNDHKKCYYLEIKRDGSNLSLFAPTAAKA